MTDNYQDIINRQYQPERPRMSVYDRAAQFAPFAALTGFGAIINERARLTDSLPEKDEELCGLLNEKIRILKGMLGSRPEVELICFVPDTKKSGGAIENFSGKLRRIDEFERVMEFTDRTKIPLDFILFIDF